MVTASSDPDMSRLFVFRETRDTMEAGESEATAETR